MSVPGSPRRAAGNGAERVAARRPAPAFPDRRDEHLRPPIIPAVCCVCGDPADLPRGALIRLGWFSGGASSGWKWAHRRCGVASGAIAPPAAAGR